jgi:trk system potassium uptake protein TrkH
MLSRWKSPLLLERKKRRYTTALVRVLYRRSGFNALPMIALGFLGLILLGSVLLTLPVASATGHRVPWFDALFTSTSAVCVTGLVVRDTGTAYSTFGHVVLMFLIESGGLGFMTFATLLFRLMGRGFTMRDRLIMLESLNQDNLGGVVNLVMWVARSTFIVQITGAALFSIRLIPIYGVAKGLFFSAFHAVSAFCNAGFDLFGGGRSMTGFSGDVLMNLTAIALVVVGGLGFGTVHDIVDKKCFRRLRLNTKLVLVSYGTLLLAGFVAVLAFEWGKPHTLGPLNTGEKMLAALFQSVTLRTAGFNTIDQAGLRDSTKLVGGILMLIGCAPASTGGGIKVTTFALIVLTVRMVARGESSIVVFKRRIDHTMIQRAVAIAFIAITVAFVDICALSLIQPGYALLDLFYECVSAVGTVGISAIGTANLRPLGRLLIIISMYIGRIGPLTMALLFMKRQTRARELVKYPEDRVMLG